MKRITADGKSLIAPDANQHFSPVGEGKANMTATREAARARGAPAAAATKTPTTAELDKNAAGVQAIDGT